jgi:glycosyltransferase involved in cell wall biosynthesis
MGGLDPCFGGAAVAPVGTALAARLAGAQNFVVFPAPRAEAPWKDDVAKSFAVAGIGVAVFPLSRLFPRHSARWGISFALARWLVANTRRFDLVHAHGAWTFTTLIALLASKLTGRPAVLSTHESLTHFDLLKSGAVGRAAKRALRCLYFSAFDQVIVSSELELRDTRRRGAHIAVVPHALPESPARLPHRRAGHRDLRVGYLGRLDPKKNVDVVIEAVADLPDLFLEIGGTGPERLAHDLRALAARLDLTDRVAWRGFVEASAKSAFFADVDVVLMPSDYECFGVAAAEAMCASVPVVVSTNTGVASIVAKYGAGFIIEPTVAELRRALESLISDRVLLERLARGAAAAAGEFAVDRHGARLWEHYARLTAAPRTRLAPVLGDRQ